MEAPTLGLAEAAKACGVSESTIRRKRTELLAKGAVQTDKGWRIPVPVLVELGLMQRTTPAPAADTPVQAPTTAQTDSLTGDVQAELERVRALLVEAERRAAVAEAVAAERDRIIEAQARSLRMLEAGPAKAPATAAPSLPAESPADTSLSPVSHAVSIPPEGLAGAATGTTKAAPQG
ncbi:hypothetical protein, partial [Arthrobacter mobilis]|uniref:hypothetical protein n=1 Tax=Arthrobacter mobilis TaxID=2724944 RepID=UPI00197C1365